jgi:predicted DNA-binding transcriptional regulator YafY
VCLAPGQRDLASIEGLLIDFRYTSRDYETSRRCLLCWQCGRDDKRIYIRGYCPFREALRTFRVDRMQDVMAMQAGRYVAVEDVDAYFAAYAAGRTKASARLLLDLWDD